MEILVGAVVLVILFIVFRRAVVFFVEEILDIY